RRIVERSEPVGLLLDDDDGRELLEAKRHVQPPEAFARLVSLTARRLGLTNRSNAPRTVTGADPTIIGHGDLFAVDANDTTPGADLRESRRVENRARTGSKNVGSFHDCRE